MRIARTAGALVAATVAAVGSGAALSACSPAKSSSTTTTHPPRTTTTHPVTTTTGAPPTSAPTTTTGLTPCQPSQLDIVDSGFSGAAGTVELTFSLTNTSSATCAMYGYPGMLLLGPGGAAQPTTVVRGGGLAFENVAPTAVTLAPGKVAYFNVGYSDVVSGNTGCSSATATEVTPPTDTAHAVVAVKPTIQACDNGTLHVSAVFPQTDTAATQTTAPS